MYNFVKNRYFFLLGIIVGGISAYLGIGGGVMLVPVLTVFYKYPIKKSIGTSLVILPLTAFTGLIMHLLLRHMPVNVIIVCIISAGAILGARAGVFLSGKVKSKYVKIIFAVFLIYVGMKQFGFMEAKKIIFGDNILLFIFLGIVAGLSSSFLGIGGGVVLVPSLNMLLGFPINDAIILSLAVIIPTAAAGVYFHSRKQNVDFEAAKHIIPGAMFGAVVGAIFSTVSSAETLHGVLGTVLILLAFKMMISDLINFRVSKI